jgi:hypothetical protein
MSLPECVKSKLHLVPDNLQLSIVGGYLKIDFYWLYEILQCCSTEDGCKIVGHITRLCHAYLVTHKYRVKSAADLNLKFQCDEAALGELSLRNLIYYYLQQ